MIIWTFLIFPTFPLKFNHYNPPRSLTELTRQITPPTKNGHAPPSIGSCKSSQSVVWAPCASELPQAPVSKWGWVQSHWYENNFLFSCKLESFSPKSFCIKPRVESWSHWNSEMAYSGLSLICCLLTQMKGKCHLFTLPYTDIQGGTQQIRGVPPRDPNLYHFLYSWTCLQWPRWGQKKVAIIERWKQEWMYGFFTKKK